MNVKADALNGGFSEPVFESQAIFKKLMDGMARPGTLQNLDVAVKPPAPLGMATGGILLTVCDHDTSVWLSAPLARSAVASWIAFHTGAPLAAEKTDARFAVIEAGSGLASFGLFAQGTQEYPDRSTTLIIEVGDLENGPAMTLSGPGIRETTIIHPSGLPDIFQRLWTDNRAIFPRGVDIILTAADRFLCLPRTVRIKKTEN